MARLFPLNQSHKSGGGLWWYSLLLWDLSGVNCSINPAQLSPPALSSNGYVVSRFDAPPCEDGAPAASCVRVFSEGTPPLGMATETSGTGRSTDIRLHQIAPVLSGGWVLLGEQAKYVAVSPQRFMSAHVSGLAAVASASDALSEDELIAADHSNELLGFTVLGEPGESVDVAVIAPPTRAVAANGVAADDAVAGGVVIVLKVVVGAAGKSGVECGPGKVGCRVRQV